MLPLEKGDYSSPAIRYLLVNTKIAETLLVLFQVVANAVAALSEMNEASISGAPLIEMNAQTINKLLTALNECTEWGQVGTG